MVDKRYIALNPAKDDTWYFDKSAITSAGFSPFMVKNARTLKNATIPVCVHSTVRKELMEALETGDKSSGENMLKCLNILAALESRNVVQFVGNALEPGTSSQQYLELLVKYRNKKKISFVTNNEELIHDIALQNSLRSFMGNKIAVYNIADDGSLIQAKDISFGVSEGTSENSESTIDAKTQRFLDLFGL